MEKRKNKISLKDFFSKYPVLSYKKNQVLIHADGVPTGIYFIKNGYVKMTAVLETGREITLNIFKPNAYFPMIWALTDLKNRYYFQTVTAVRLRHVPRNELLEFLHTYPDELMELTKRILRGIHGLLINIEYQLSGDSYHRVIAALVLAVNRFGVDNHKGKINIKLPLTHQEIAGFAGLTRETVSLAMKKLSIKKIISYNGRTLLINNVEELNRESLIYQEENTNPNTL